MKDFKELCYVCGDGRGFSIDDKATHLSESRCVNCKGLLRSSDTARCISEIYADGTPLSNSIDQLSGLHILNHAPFGSIHKIIHSLPHYQCSEYFDGTPSGQLSPNGILCVDFYNMPFPDDSFDLIITEDVFEHIEYPLKAFSEITRALKAGGRHIFTVPIKQGKTRNRKGLPPAHHYAPPGSAGAYVHFEWGYDICDVANACGTETEYRLTHDFYEPSDIFDLKRDYNTYIDNINQLLYVFKYNINCFISKKTSMKTAHGYNDATPPPPDQACVDKALASLDINSIISKLIVEANSLRTIRFERDALKERNETLKTNNEALKAKNEALKSDNEVLKASHQALEATIKTLEKENRTLMESKEALRFYYESSKSWKVTKPLRSAIELLRRNKGFGREE